jgi:protein-S-isoprenylcysteine O-methyltransferase Ste14
LTRDFVVWSYYAYFGLFLLVEFVFTRFRLGSGKEGDRDRLSFLFFFVAPFIGMFTWMTLLNRGIAPANPSWPQWILGYAIGLVGFSIRFIAKRALGRFFTVRVQLQEDHEVVDQGIYAAVRHPLYLGYILEWIAPPLILGSPTGFLLVTLPIVIGVLQRIRREEKLLVEGLGQKYRDYMGRTKRLIPGVW